MTTSSTRYAILGGGRLARHMRHYLSLQGFSCAGWARNPDSPLNSCHQRDPEVRLRATLSGATHVLLLVSDDALAPLLKQYPFLHQHLLIHCAGALSLPGVAGAHPLMTFGEDRYDMERYAAIPFMVEGGYSFDELFPGLPNPHYEIATSQKAFYHALCVMAGNFPQVLWQAVGGRLQEELGAPPEALRAYLQQSLDNFLADPRHALTGPLARGDSSTLKRNQQALGADSLAELYGAFVTYHESEKAPQLRQKVS